MEHIRYKKETEVVTFQGKEITLENLSPGVHAGAGSGKTPGAGTAAL